MGKSLHLIVILQAVSSAFAYRYDHPWYRTDTDRPVDVITDVVNELGVRILQQYLTRGNVAFSPTGIAFVLAALYEGSAGRGSQQIAEAIGLPTNRDVTRIGFRDIHRRLRSYLNADGFLGGLTLSRENTKLRPDYEDILRFYGFDLSSIEQEVNVTVSMEDSSGITELPTSTIGSSMPSTEMANTENVPDMTTTTSGAIMTLPPAGAETTVVPSTAAGVTQQTVTMASTGATDVQSTLASVTSTGTIVQNISPTQSINSLVTSGESIQPTSSAETIVGSSNTITPIVNTDSQMIPTTNVVTVAGNQGQQTSPTVIAGDSATSASVSNESVQPSTGAGTTATVIDADVTMNTDVSTFATNTEIPMITNMLSSNSPTTIVTDPSIDALVVASLVVNMTSANTTIPNATLNTVIMNSLTTVVPVMLNSADVTISSPVTETMMVNGVNLQSSTETSADTPIGNTPGMIAANDLTMTTINIDDAIAVSSVTTAVPSVSATNANNLAGNNFTIANSMMSSINQMVASLVDENTISNRKKKDIINLLDSIINSNTVKDESHDRSPNLRKARSLRGYFSSYPDEGIWMQNLEIWKSYNTANPSESSNGDTSAEMSFLVNGCDVSSVSASRYIAVLPFAYFPSLQAVALEFPLDDPRYNIILFMPTDKTDTLRLARDLSGKSLRLLRKRLQPTWVRATIPSFMLRGFVTLTSFLQRLGILDVFEPRVADLSPMTSDLGVYARDVQQSIGVNIRNYMKPDRTHSRNGLFERAGPEPFTVLHPFLYFIVDTETSVSLIAGRVDDPLNSRIL
ncbi:Leukocyte elastase inhibitor [Atta colombica]|uniref:Leukocyte elastase inhibitor n=1 Tax=Atta colombica TaxID=520822 RepID=A0A195AUF3_9HYME|nr:PREDICTED: uncharacterized protein LOC108693375 [Atta colombica]KYM75687.1 Leukocyte elastase inhibitor [Atta colombica]